MKRFLPALALLLTLPSPTLATTLLWMDVENLSRDSTAVVMGTVISQRTWTSEPGIPLQEFSFHVTRALKGNLSGTIQVYNPGLPGASALTEGDELILFLYSREGMQVLTGFQQGIFRIVTDRSGRRVLERGIPSQRPSVAGTHSVEALVSEIQAALEIE